MAIFDKFTVINRALIDTGNDPLSNLLEDSDIGIACNIAFDRAIDFLTVVHNWPFSRKEATLVDSGTTGIVPPWTNIMTYPVSAWHISNVVSSLDGNGQDYKLIKSGILTLTNLNLKCHFVERMDTRLNWHPMATEVMTLLLQASIERGPNGDLEAGAATQQRAEAMLMRATTRVDQQSPPRNGYLTNVAQRRRTRKVQ